MRNALNAHQAEYFDMHLSELAQDLRYGFLGKIDVAIVEAADVTEDGEIVPMKSFRLAVWVFCLQSAVWPTVSSLN